MVILSEAEKFSASWRILDSEGFIEITLVAAI
jgi:hypothetical protein